VARVEGAPFLVPILCRPAILDGLQIASLPRFNGACPSLSVRGRITGVACRSSEGCWFESDLVFRPQN
jgi:hypothetical protein